jgi:hypothetical protein
MLPLETKQSRDKLLPHSDLRGGVFLGEISSSRSHYSKKGYKGKKNEQHSYKIEMWNVRTLNRGGKLKNLKKEMQKNKVAIVINVNYELCIRKNLLSNLVILTTVRLEFYFEIVC